MVCGPNSMVHLVLKVASRPKMVAVECGIRVVGDTKSAYYVN